MMRFQAFSKQQKFWIISSVIIVVLLITALLSTVFVRAWFKDIKEITNPAVISNFKASVQYSKNGTTWTSVNSDGSIPIASLDELDNIQVRIEYKGHSAAYLRTSLYGHFYNKNTGTYLPISESFWSMAASDSKKASLWNRLNNGEFWYYTQRVMGAEAPDQTVLLPSLKVHADVSSLGTVSQHQEYEGKLYIVVDAVQPDRCEAFWGVAPSEFVS